MPAFNVHAWERDPRNPILPPGKPEGGGFDVGCCMNPFVLRRGEEYWLYYAGADKNGARRICLAIAPVNDLTNWRRLGPLFDLGDANAFDADWCVLPCLHQFGSTWHLYYTGYNGRSGKGLQAFRGIGLATSTDLLHWRKYSAEPVLTGEGFSQWPDNHGMAGAGNILELPGDGGPVYRMYYTLSTGHPAADGKPDIFVEQAKQSVCAHSRDGITWSDKRVMLMPSRERDYENVGVIGLNVWKSKSAAGPGGGPGGYRAIYSAIGTRFGMYSICEATSADGVTWERGKQGENLSLAPRGDGWEKDMVEYPCVIEEHGRLRLFYCGNGFGATGIGTAVATPL
jgi:hypothetical protein